MAGHFQEMRHLALRGGLTTGPESTTLLHRKQHGYPDWVFLRKKFTGVFLLFIRLKMQQGKKTILLLCSGLDLLA